MKWNSSLDLFLITYRLMLEPSLKEMVMVKMKKTMFNGKNNKICPAAKPQTLAVTFIIS